MNNYDSDDAVAWLVHLHGGELVGRTRLQKEVYFLERARLGWGFEFEYHNYGPYSADLAYAADLGLKRQKLDAEERPGGYGIAYTVYKANGRTGMAAADKNRDQRRKQMLELLRSTKAVPLELAATFDFIEHRHLRRTGVPPEVGVVWQDVLRLKPTKATPENIADARQILGTIKEFLSPNA